MVLMAYLCIDAGCERTIGDNDVAKLHLVERTAVRPERHFQFGGRRTGADHYTIAVSRVIADVVAASHRAKSAGAYIVPGGAGIELQFTVLKTEGAGLTGFYTAQVKAGGQVQVFAGVKIVRFIYEGFYQVAKVGPGWAFSVTELLFQIGFTTFFH